LVIRGDVAGFGEGKMGLFTTEAQSGAERRELRDARVNARRETLRIGRL